MSISLMHHLKPEVRTVENVSPGIDYTTTAIKQRLVEVETIEVECHGANTESGKPDANYRPGSEEEVQRT